MYRQQRAYAVKLKRFPIAARMMLDSILTSTRERSRRKRTLAQELNVFLDKSLRLRLPDMIFEPANLNGGNPDFSVYLEMPLTASDLVIEELDAIVKNQKKKVDIKISSRGILTLVRSGEDIFLSYSQGLARQYHSMKRNTANSAVQEYKSKRQNYGPDGKYRSVCLGGLPTELG